MIEHATQTSRDTRDGAAHVATMIENSAWSLQQKIDRGAYVSDEQVRTMHQLVGGHNKRMEARGWNFYRVNFRGRPTAPVQSSRADKGARMKARAAQVTRESPPVPRTVRRCPDLPPDLAQAAALDMWFRGPRVKLDCHW